jgi:tetratricopeptide (TPR) repeat protein
MKSTSARISILWGATLMFFLGVGAGIAQPAQAQSEEISDQDKKVHYSLYYEDFKNQNFESALPNLKWIIENVPAYPSNDDRNFERLVETYAGIAEKAESEELKKAYLDSALAVFDVAGPALKEAGAEYDEEDWLIKKGRFIQENSQMLPEATSSVADIYLAAYETAGCEIDPYYIRVIIDNHARSDRKQQAVELMDEAEACYSDNAEMMTYITEVRNTLFESPDERMAFLEGRLENNPDDIEIVSELFEIYVELGERDKAAQLGKTLLEMQPTARTYRLLAKMHLEDGEAAEALALYEEALNLPGAEELKRDIYFNMGIAQQQMGRLQNARTNFRKALEEDPKFGQAYIAIGDLYVTAVSECGSFERDDRAVYWLAVDYYERAKATDPNLSAQANQKISTYRRTFPDQEMLFFKNWEPGQSVRIDYGCYSWIGETTTVRSP